MKLYPSQSPSHPAGHIGSPWSWLWTAITGPEVSQTEQRLIYGSTVSASTGIMGIRADDDSQ